LKEKPTVRKTLTVACIYPLGRRSEMRLIYFYRYRHPLEQGKFVYVGQSKNPAHRDVLHRSGEEGFGRRYKRKFGGMPLLPMDVGWHEPVIDELEAKVIEAEGMFRFHTWHSPRWPSGMNEILPGKASYAEMGIVGARNQPREAKVRNGLRRGAQAIATGQLASIASLGGAAAMAKMSHEAHVRGGRIGGKRMSKEDRLRVTSLAGRNKPMDIRVRDARVGGQTTAKIHGHMAKASFVGQCVRYHIKKGLPCICGHHTPTARPT
jgi:hypothetical protein